MTSESRRDRNSVDASSSNESQAPASEADGLAATTDSLPESGCLLGIDFGTKRIGVAYCDALQIVATPLHNYNRGTLKDDEQFFLAAIKEYSAVGAVVGLPVHISGDESRKSKEAKRFAAWLTRRTSVPVAFQDERYSSVQAEAHLAATGVPQKRRKDSVDMVAAQIILNDFLKSRQS